LTSRALGRATVLLLALSLSFCGRKNETVSPPLDLLGLTYVVFAPEGELGLESPVTLGDDARPALTAPTPAEFRYRLRIPENALLTFALGIAAIPSSTGEKSLSGNHMRFTVRGGEGQADQVLFDREIHLSRRDRWLPQAIDLKRYAGREIWLVFQTTIPGEDPSLGPPPVVGVFGEPILHDRGAYRASKGVVLISIDTLRRDHMSLYGYPRRTTPGLEGLAHESVVFEDVVSTSSWTLPAHASLLTSTLPSIHGATSGNVGLSPAFPGLPRLLSDAGYFTQAMVTHVYLSKEYGFGEGFDRHRYFPETRAQEVTDQAIHFLEAKGDSDFFLFLHYYDPHWHYDPPAPYDRAFDPSYQGEATGIWWDFKELDAESIDPKDLHHIQALYDGEILYTDRQLERLFQEMKRLGVFENALVVVTSDHGEEFLDHGQWEHQKTLYEEQLRVPLLIKFPNVPNGLNGAMGSRRVSGQVSLVDVAPTVLDALGVPAPMTFEGRSLLRASRGSELPEAEAWAETEHTLDGSRKVALRRGAFGEKAIFTLKEGDVAIELFDLARDPRETKRLDAGASRSLLERRLAAYLTEAEARRGGKTPPAVELDPEDLERLRSLGYLK
jgi:arylsulfatase A-like enzyme